MIEIFSCFDYGFLGRQNHPAKVVLESSGNGIGLNYVQILDLVKNTPRLFGDIIHKENRNWNLQLLFHQILNIVFSHSLTFGMATYLKHLIVEHHKLFKHLYQNRNPWPMHHFMIHYPSSIRKIGPLLYMQSRGFEAKHKVFKDYF